MTEENFAYFLAYCSCAIVAGLATVIMALCAFIIWKLYHAYINYKG